MQSISTYSMPFSSSRRTFSVWSLIGERMMPSTRLESMDMMFARSWAAS